MKAAAMKERKNKRSIKVVNLDYLQELSQGDEGFVQEMIGIFIDENPGEIRELGNSIQLKDYEGIRSSAHKLKSSIPFVGLNRIIEEEVSRIEGLSANGDGILEIEKLFPKIESACHKARIELNAFRK
jgi:HPt (histidine-containing phosphotransfer) domain-containing protein